MRKQQPEPKWLDNLKALIAHRHLNPRALSLKAGLNATAVRDMLEGRARFPRYDTIESMAKVLDVTPAQLMSSTPEAVVIQADDPTFVPRDPLGDEDLNLLTEIISRLQEVVEEQKQQLKARDFAAMVTTIYRQVRSNPIMIKTKGGLEPQISHLITYETLRKRATGKK